MYTGQVLTAGKGYNPYAGGGGNVFIFCLVKRTLLMILYSLWIGSGGNGFGGFGTGQTGNYH
jgi:hypothetical protein